jgi:hypothetical protein
MLLRWLAALLFVGGLAVGLGVGMTPVSDLCGGIMKHRTGLLAAPACAVAAAALLAAPALASARPCLTR